MIDIFVFNSSLELSIVAVVCNRAENMSFEFEACEHPKGKYPKTLLQALTQGHQCHNITSWCNTADTPSVPPH